MSAEPERLPAARSRTYRFVSVVAIALIGTATVVYRLVEDWTWVDSFYFSVIAVTTVGFGDLTPTTDFTKLFTVAYIIVGVSLVAAVINERLRRHHEALSWLAHRAERRGGDRDDRGGSGDRG